MPQANQPTNQQSLTPMQQQQAPTQQPQQSAHPGYSGMFFDDVTAMSHHTTPKESVKSTVKDSQHNVVVGNTGAMQMPHPHPYAVPQQHAQQTAPTQPTYKQPQAASSQSKFSNTYFSHTHAHEKKNLTFPNETSFNNAKVNHKKKSERKKEKK